MVLLIAGPPVEVGVTMYVLSISSVSEVLMVQFAFSNSYRTHIDSRSFISFWPFLFVRACTDACTPFSFTLFMENSTIHRESDRGELNRRTYDTIHRSFLHANDQSGSIDRIEPRDTKRVVRTNQLFERVVHPTMPLVSDCLFHDYPIRMCVRVYKRSRANINTLAFHVKFNERTTRDYARRINTYSSVNIRRSLALFESGREILVFTDWNLCRVKFVV